MTDLREAAEMALEALIVSHPMANTDKSLDKHSEAMSALRQALAQPEQEPILTEKDGSPCPEFWDWLPKAYNFEDLGGFTKYNMEVAFLAGKNTALAQPEPVMESANFATNFVESKHLAQPEQEPVAWMDSDGNICDWECPGYPIPLYTKEQA